MAQNFQDYENALKYGAKIIDGNMAAGTLTNASIASSTIKGSNLTLTKTYSHLAVSTNGTAVAVNLFGSSTAPVTGTVTGFFTVAASTVTGTATLWSTTAGTIATITFGSTIGLMTGTAVVNAAVTAGDTVTVTSATSGTATAFVTFVSAN